MRLVLLLLLGGCSLQHRQTVNTTWPVCIRDNYAEIQYITNECLRNSGKPKVSKPELGKSCYRRAAQWKCAGLR